MDPDRCYSELLELLSEGDIESASDNARNLRNWLDNGGFYPSGATRNEVWKAIARASAVTA